MTLNERLCLLRDGFENSANRRELLRSELTGRSGTESDARGQPQKVTLVRKKRRSGSSPKPSPIWSMYCSTAFARVLVPFLYRVSAISVSRPGLD